MEGKGEGEGRELGRGKINKGPIEADSTVIIMFYMKSSNTYLTLDLAPHTTRHKCSYEKCPYHSISFTESCALTYLRVSPRSRTNGGSADR